MHQVLSVGADLSLLYTRSLVLEKAGASVKAATPDQAFFLLDNPLDNCTFDLLVICHSTHDHDMHRICRAARAHAIKILLIESPTGTYQVPVDVDDRFMLEDGPELLIRTVKHMLAAPAPGETTPIARLVAFVRSRKPSSHQRPPLETLAQPHPEALRTYASGEEES